MQLSVIVTIVDAGEALARCLHGLALQQGAPGLDVIVPWDDSVDGIPALEARFRAFRFLPLGSITTSRPKNGHAGQHELFDRRRSAGLAAATGDVIGILEDRGVPRPDWARAMAALHEALPHAVIGGAIENGRNAALNWAAYFCDFGRFQRPFTAGPRRYISDVNIGYKRRALDLTADLWKTRYHETTVHWTLLRAGETLYLSPEPVVDELRDGLAIAALLRERLAWGRLFAFTRARELGIVKRIVLAALTPLLPFVLVVRHGREQFTRRRTFGRYVAVSPIVFLLLVAWSVGEAAGYVTGEP